MNRSNAGPPTLRASTLGGFARGARALGALALGAPAFSALAFGALALSLPSMAAASTPGATLRPDAMLAQPVVHLSDLFNNAGADGARVLGPAPAPGNRFTVEAAQLAAIARQYRVDWQPAAGNERVVVERAGRMASRDLVVAALRGAIHEAGATPDVEVEVANFSSPMIATDAPPRASVEQLDYDAAGERFAATVLISGGAGDEQRIRVVGRAAAMADIVVPARRLAAGSVIRADDVRTARVRVSVLRDPVALAPEQLIGRSLLHAGYAGQPVLLADVARPADIAKGARVAMELAAPGLLISGVGVALESGAVGEIIHVLNPGSRAVLEATVTGPATVRVDPESHPVLPGSPMRPHDAAGRTNGQAAGRSFGTQAMAGTQASLQSVAEAFNR